MRKRENDSSHRPGTARSVEAERNLLGALPAILPLHRLSYQRHWFAGLSDFPGNGMEQVELTRNGKDFIGHAKIDFRAAFGGTATCTAPVAIASHQLEALFHSLAAPVIGYGVVDFLAPDYAEDRRLCFEAVNEKKLAFAKGSAMHDDFWGYVPEGQYIGNSTEVCGVRAPEFSRISALLEEKCGLNAQSSTLWKMLKDWALHKHVE